MVRDPVGESVAWRLLHIVDEAPIGPADLRMASLFTLDSLAEYVERPAARHSKVRSND